MSIKKDNVNVTAVKYNSQDVNKVILDNKCVWCKPFTYTQGTLPTGVASLTCTRSSTDEPTASTGTIANGGTIYYDDKLYWTATASTGYRITAIKGSGSPVTVSGAITGTSSSGVTSERISGTISQGTLPIGVASIICYRKAYNESSFSKYTGSTIYYGDQFYWTATATIEYTNPSLTYNSSSKVYTWTGSQGDSINSVKASGLSAGVRKSFWINFGITANKTLYGSWSIGGIKAEYGDKITVSDNSVTCYTWYNTSTIRWTATVTSYPNDAQYTYSAVTIIGSDIASVTAETKFTAWNTRTLNSYTITWNYLSAYPDTWTTETQTYDYGATPSKTVSNVTSGSFRKVPTSWDNLDTVTGNRTITANYKTQVYITWSGTRCSMKINGKQPTTMWRDIGDIITWTADPNCAFSSDGSTTTISETISTQKTNYTASADYINVTSVSGTNCTAYTDSNCTTPFTTGWYYYTTRIYWKASKAYTFDAITNRETADFLASPGANTAQPEYVKHYKLIILATNGSYGTYSVSRTKSPYQGASTGALADGADIYYGDVLTGTYSVKPASYDDWSVTSVTAPTFTTTGDATSGNLTITNKSSYQATLYYNTWNAVGGTSAGTAAANGSVTVTGLEFNKQYYISARVNRTRTKHTYATDGDQYSGTNGVTDNVWATFTFKDTTSTEIDTIDSAVVAAKTAAQNQYTIIWKYLSDYPDTWTRETQTYKYGDTPSRASPSTVTSYINRARKVFVKWDNLTTVTGNRTITAVYITQFAPIIDSDYCTSNKSSDTWYISGTIITWTANDNYSFGGSTVKDTTTQTITSGGTYSATPGYVKCTISGTNCQADKSNGSILPVGETITWTGSTGTNSKYGFSNTNPDSTTSTARVALGSTSYSKTAPYLWYNVTSVTGTHCSAYSSNSYTAGFAKGWYLEGTKIYWKTTESPYAMTTSNDTTLTVAVQPGNNNRSAVVKRYTFKLTKNTNVYSIKVWRTASKYQNATIGNSNNPLITGTGTATIYYGDTLQGIATASTGYHFDNSNITTSKPYSSGSITANKSWSPTVSINKYTINLNLSVLPSNVTVEEKWLSLEQNSNATHYPVGSTFNYNQTIYAIITVQRNNAIDTTASGWSTIWSNGQYSTYVIGSITAQGTESSLTITPKVVLLKYTVTASSNNIGLRSTYLSTLSNGTEGRPKLEVDYGTTVYGYAELGSTVTTDKVSNWNLVHGEDCKPDAIYRVGSKKIIANTTYNINLFDESDYSSVVFKEAGLGGGSWTVKNHEIQSAGNMGKIRQVGNSIYGDYDDYNGSTKTQLLGSYTCPAGYTVEFQLKDYNGHAVPWDSWIELKGPYIVTAVVGFETTTT